MSFEHAVERRRRDCFPKIAPRDCPAERRNDERLNGPPSLPELESTCISVQNFSNLSPNMREAAREL